MSANNPKQTSNEHESTILPINHDKKGHLIHLFISCPFALGTCCDKQKKEFLFQYWGGNP